MLESLLFIALVIIICIAFNKFSKEMGVPMLLTFIILGMLFGTDGIFKINFNDFKAAEIICTIALIFIMFYGGFGTRWSEAKEVSVKAILLATVGVVSTALLTGLFCHFILRLGLIESFLIGSVLSSTDAASVFSILRGKKLSLKYKTDSMIELESGSNDPCAYMLTIIFLSFLNGGLSGGEIFITILKQVIIAIVLAATISYISIWFLKRLTDEENGFDSIFVMAIALVSYALPSYFGGNGYLSAYLVGIILGNYKLSNKKALVNFFDGITGLMQILIFFLLGLLSTPSILPKYAFLGLSIILFLSFVARPVSVFMILSPFKSHKNQQLFVSFAGLRGAASIVFAIMVMTSTKNLQNDIFHITFFIVLFSIAIQGGLLPFMAKKLSMIDSEKNILKTFSDYVDEVPVQFIELEITNGHTWENKLIKEISLPSDLLLAVIERGEEKIIPNGSTKILVGDKIILSAKAIEQNYESKLYEILIDKNHKWVDKNIANLDLVNSLVVIIKRKGKVIVPRGNTKILLDDVLVINQI